METVAAVVETRAAMVETMAVVVAEVQAAVAMVVETNVVRVTAVASVGTSSDSDSGDDSIVAL